MSYKFVVIFIVARLWCEECVLHLERASTVRLPTVSSPSLYEYNTGAVGQCALGLPGSYYLYCSGNKGLLHVLRYNSLDNLKLVTTYRVSGDIRDVQVCGNVLALSMANSAIPTEGSVKLYRLKYGSYALQKITSIGVQSAPRHLAFAHSCRQVVVALEGSVITRPYLFDPEGMISIINFRNGYDGEYEVTNLDFKEFNSNSYTYENLRKRVYTVNHSAVTKMHSSFSQSLEPYDVTINSDESKTYVSLAVNNAIAEISLLDPVRILNLIPLDSQSHVMTPIDTSNQDGGILMRTWNMSFSSMKQPKFIHSFFANGQDYLLTANSGKPTSFKTYPENVTFSDTKTGYQIYTEHSSYLYDQPSLRSALMSSRDLGVMNMTSKIATSRDPRYPSRSSRYVSVKALGGRSLSLVNTDGSEVWNTNQELEALVAVKYPRYFNADPTRNLSSDQTFDLQSTTQGPKPEALEVAIDKDQVVAVVGLDNPGMLAVYASPVNANPLNFQFQSMAFNCESDFGESFTWQQWWNYSWVSLPTSRRCSDLNPDDIIIAPKDYSPTGSPIVFTAGSVSGTVSVHTLVDRNSDAFIKEDSHGMKTKVKKEKTKKEKKKKIKL